MKNPILAYPRIPQEVDVPPAVLESLTTGKELPVSKYIRHLNGMYGNIIQLPNLPDQILQKTVARALSDLWKCGADTSMFQHMLAAENYVEAGEHYRSMANLMKSQKILATIRNPQKSVSSDSCEPDQRPDSEHSSPLH